MADQLHRGMATNVSADEIQDGIIAALADITAPPGTKTDDYRPIAENTDASRPLRQVAPYIAAELEDEEMFRRGIAGRCPAARVNHSATRSMRTTIGRKTDRVESTFEVVVVDDMHSAPHGRQRIKGAIEKIRHRLAARALGLQIQPLRFKGTTKHKDTVNFISYVIAFAARHRTNYTIDPGAETIRSVSGEIFDAGEDAADPPRTQEVELTFVETP